MPMLAIFGAEVVGAEILAAEAAAAAAAEAAAIEAAQVAAAEAAAQEAARQAATQQAAQAVATNPGITGVPDPSQLAAKGSFNPATGEFVNTTLPTTPPSASYPPLEVGNNPFNKPFPEYSNFQAAPPAAPPSPFTPNTPPMGLEMPGAYTPQNYPMGMDGQFTANQFIEPGSAGVPSMENTIAQANIPTTPPSALEGGFTKAMEWADKNPFKASAIAYTGANALGLLDPSAATFNQEKYNGPLSKYKLSPNFQAGSANPANFQYQPRYAAGGGIMGSGSYDIPVGYNEGGDMPEYAKGGSLSDSIESYQKMLSGKPMEAPPASRDVGIYYDQDPDTRYQDALTAAQIRQAKVNQRAYVSPPVAKRPTPLGKLNMPTSGKSKSGDDVEAAAGGMMRSYAGGGITGSGNLDLHIPLDLGGGGGGGYTPVGGGFNFGNGGSGNTSVFSGLNNTVGNNFGIPNEYGPLVSPGQLARDFEGHSGSTIGGRSRPTFSSTYTDTTRVPGTDYGSRPPPTFSSTNTDTTRVPGTDYGLNMPVAGYAMGGGISSLGGYAAGGNPRLLKGPGDGMSDNIPATINGRQPARLADGEFVIPADVVSHLGNGSTEAGAKQLHAMMNKVRKARTGNPKQGKNIRPQKYMPK